ncbi:hypothetical protein SAMN05444851_1549 [Aliiroseovarius sediminilitoris]|uniref:Uncharacterized protein n=1 Tax=Aliiroseovarius sediminilitoris TaxID=1173584 RepID=A0A1I0PEY4_9RHOB|nr:DUF6544 family protein [Aliiroseovarius sediminilitoris]SEW12189.1 hypothetical protein SAMN05444851_1549 [Aliiroseovarius sediminilitoris]
MKPLKILAIGAAAVIAATASVVIYSSAQTEADIAAFQSRIADIGATIPAVAFDAAQIADLPEPVQRYFEFVFTGPVPVFTAVQLKAEGKFRRPLTEGFNDATAEQVIAVGTPALMFSATTPVLPGVRARAYDFFAKGQMEMKAKILSTLTVVDERETPELNRISLRRWLLESALFPQALLPGGPVTWDAIDRSSARATVTADGLSASMVAHFDDEGRLTQMAAEEDGDLTTPYHGSGEHVTRGDYRPVGNLMVPHTFTISRSADGALYPFFEGRITDIRFLTE